MLLQAFEGLSSFWKVQTFSRPYQNDVKMLNPVLFEVLGVASLYKFGYEVLQKHREVYYKKMIALEVVEESK